MKNNLVVRAALVLAAIVLVFYVGLWRWGFSRVYVRPGEILVITSKFGTENPDPDRFRVVPQGTKGVWEEVMGEGRHFYDPVSYQTETVDAIIEIGPEEVGVVESLSGSSLPPGEFLAKPGQKGILQVPLTPGRWRLNPFAFRVTKEPATRIRPGSVGAVTRLSGEFSAEGQLAAPGQRGVQKDVLQPGIYYLNPREYKVDEIWIGYTEITLENVSFPSSDGFTIKLDVSVVWGLLPKDVPTIVSRFGNPQAVINKIIRPQLESICRIEGSKYGAKDFIEGTTREQFQKTFTDQLMQETKIRNIDVLIGLVRDIDVPQEVRVPIQNAKIAAEEQLTKEEERKSQVIQNELEELKAEVTKGVREVGAETEKMVGAVKAEGQRRVAGIGGEREVAVAEIRKQVALTLAEKDRILGKAEADVTELLQKAEADRFQRNVSALGGGEAYASYTFVKGLPDDLKLQFRYAGPGTLWTDLPGGSRGLEDAAIRKMLERESQGATGGGKK
jgi:regulator of protease activity HflC (stomatin/prohibitin superfamily)